MDGQTLKYLVKNDNPHLWSAKDSEPSSLSVPAEANMTVVSRSPMMPLMVLAALMQAWVPLAPACSDASTYDTWRQNITLIKFCIKCNKKVSIYLFPISVGAGYLI